MRLATQKPRKRSEPIRPCITPVLACGIIFWAGCAAAYSAGAGVQQEDLSAWAFLTAGVAAVAAIVLGAARGKRLAIAVVSVAIGILLGLARASDVFAQTERCSDCNPCGAICELLEDPKPGEWGATCLAHAAFDCGRACTVSLKLGSGNGLLCGHVIRIDSGSIKVDSDKNGYLWRNGTKMSINVRRYEQIRKESPIDALIWVRERAIAVLGDGSEEGALLQSVVCGWRAEFSQTDSYKRLKSCGLAHLVAVSGAHLVIVTGFFAEMLRCIRCPRRVSIGILMVLMLAYFIFAGEPVSALRATIMSALGLFSYFGQRRPSSSNSIGIAIFALVGMAPECSISVSFALSCLSTLGIVLLTPLIAYWLSSTPLGRFGFVCETLSMALAAMVASQPLSCALFCQLPLIAPLANILAAPLFPIACGFGLIAGVASLFVPIAALPISLFAHVPSWLLCVIADVLSEAPYACVPAYIETVQALLATAVMIWSLYRSWPLHWKNTYLAFIAGAISISIAFVWPVGLGDRIVMLDVGQGDAFLVCSRGLNFLIDTGNQDAKLLAALARHGIVHLDGVLITHADDDHCGSLDALKSCVEVDAVYVAKDMVSCAGDNARALIAQASCTAEQVVGLKCGDRIDIGAFRGDIVWPHAFVDEGGNADSVCMVVDYDCDDDGNNEGKLLFTGDAGTEQLDAVIKEQGIGHVDILKVGHHGSRTGMDASQVRMLSPTVAMIGVGEGNRYGHPSAEIITMLEDAGTCIVRSDKDGDVSCIMGTDGIRIRRQG